MTNFDRDDLPPELSHAERMLREGRPVADEDSLDRMRPRRQPARSASAHAPRRTFAFSLATVFAMVALTGGAAAAMFGGVPLLSKPSHKTSLSAKSLSAATGFGKAARTGTAAESSLKGASGSLASALANKAAGKTTGAAVGTKAALGGGVSSNAFFPFPNAGNFQYRLRQLICRFLRRFGLNEFADLIGCPP